MAYAWVVYGVFVGSGVPVGAIAVAVAASVGVAVTCVEVRAVVGVAVWVAVAGGVAVGGTKKSCVGFNVDVGTGTVVGAEVGVPLG